MAAATNRANIGYDEARMEGKGPAVSAVDAAKAAAGRGTTGYAPGRGAAGYDQTGLDYSNGLENRGVVGGDQAQRGGLLGRTEEELARLQTRSEITGESEAYAPNPNIRGLPKEFETRVQVIQKYPEMKTVEKTDMVKEVRNEERTITVPKTRVVMDEVERVDRVPVVREVPKVRLETVHRVVTEDREVTDMVPVVEYTEVPRVEEVPRVITEEVTERVSVPVVVEIPVTRQVEVPTGKYCEAPVEQVVNPGHAGLLGQGIHHGRGGELGEGVNTGRDGAYREGVNPGRDGAFGQGVNPGRDGAFGQGVNPERDGVVDEGVNSGQGGGLNATGSSPFSSDDEDELTPVQHVNPDGSTYAAPAQPRKKRGLLNKILHH